MAKEYTELALRLREAARLKGVSQSQLARELGLTPQSAQRWFSGAAVPSEIYRTRLAELLDINPVELHDLAYQDTLTRQKQALNALELDGDSSTTGLPQSPFVNAARKYRHRQISRHYGQKSNKQYSHPLIDNYLNFLEVLDELNFDTNAPKPSSPQEALAVDRLRLYLHHRLVDHFVSDTIGIAARFEADTLTALANRLAEAPEYEVTDLNLEETPGYIDLTLVDSQMPCRLTLSNTSLMPGFSGTVYLRRPGHKHPRPDRVTTDTLARFGHSPQVLSVDVLTVPRLVEQKDGSLTPDLAYYFIPDTQRGRLQHRLVTRNLKSACDEETGMLREDDDLLNSLNVFQDLQTAVLQFQ